MEDRCISCGTDVSDQSRWYCLNCERKMNSMNEKKDFIYQIRLQKYIKWINTKPPKWKFISYIKWLKQKPPRP